MKLFHRLYSKLSDSEIISISIVSEAITIDSEKACFYFVKKNLKDLFPNISDKGYIDNNLKCQLESERDILLISYL